MENKLLKIMLIVFVVFITIWLITPNIYATIDTNYFEPSPMKQDDINITGRVGGYLIKVLTTVGVIVATLAIAVLGLKYILGSVDEKAEYKKTMKPYLIGVGMIIGTTAIVSILASVWSKREYSQRYDPNDPYGGSTSYHQTQDPGYAVELER